MNQPSHFLICGWHASYPFNLWVGTVDSKMKNLMKTNSFDKETHYSDPSMGHNLAHGCDSIHWPLVSTIRHDWPTSHCCHMRPPDQNGGPGCKLWRHLGVRTRYKLTADSFCYLHSISSQMLSQLPELNMQKIDLQRFHRYPLLALDLSCIHSISRFHLFPLFTQESLSIYQSSGTRAVSMLSEFLPSMNPQSR